MKIGTKSLQMSALWVAFAYALGCLPASAYTNLGNGVLESDGSSGDTQAAINAAPAGSTVEIPPGSFTWGSGVSINGKGIKVVGSGSGRVIGESLNTITIGTGTQVFTTTAGGLPITAGQTLTIYRTGGIIVNGAPIGVGSMIGTVTSYSGTTLTMNIASAVGVGTQSVWIIATKPTTTLVNNTSGSFNSGALFQLTEPTSGYLNLSGICFTTGSGVGDYVAINLTSGGTPVLVHDCFFISTSDLDCIYSNTNRGVIWNCSFVALPFSELQLAIHMKDCPASSWTTPSTMGTADTTGTNNMYIENCDFHGWLNALDMDDCSRSVVRNCIFNNAAFGSHGADTSNFGVRHYEIYNNTFLYNGFSNGQTLNLNWWFFLRGGTGVITGNVLPHISSQDYSSKLDVNMTVMNLQRNSGPNPCWGSGGGHTGNSYPAARQVGFGRVTGTAGNDSITYKGDSEPLYIWNNTGAYQVGTSDFGGTDCTNPDTTADYVVAGRDYFNNGTAKPGYTEYTYPHPIRAAQASSLPSQPGPLNANSP